MSDRVSLRLSQGQLNWLATCPRKFQHEYLDQLGTPADPEQQERLLAGSRFHLLMQQYHLGLPIDPLVQDDPQLQQWLQAFLDAAPTILPRGIEPEKTSMQSEHQRTLEFEGYLLTVVYDLLVMDESQAQILDWKTYPKPKTQRWLAENWQTRLYPFVLAETSDYEPEQISMTYWFFQSQLEGATIAEPQSLRFTYSCDRHETTRRDLTRLLEQLTDWLQGYWQTGEPFPQVAMSSTLCDRCSFARRCQRGAVDASIPQTVFLSLEEIEEVPL